jgi:hypothetical protein
MPTVLSSSLRHKNLNNFKNTVEDESVYFFVSKPTSWTEGDLIPPSVYDTFTLEPEAHDEMLYLKRVSISNCVNVIRLYRWQENRRYQAYSDKADLSDLLTKRTISTNEYYPFYVVTDDYRVYKCIDNGATPLNPYGVASTVEPITVAFTGSDTYTPLSDGYIWKYMFTLRPLDGSEFLTTDWFPIRTLTEDDGTDNWDIITNAVPGAVYNIKVKQGGSSYNKILPATDDLNGTNSQGFTYSGSGTSIVITSGSPSGTNDEYLGCYLYTKNASGVVQEVVEITDYVGSTNTLTLSGSVTGSLRAYISPKVVATGNGSGLIAIARMSSNALREIQIFSPGTGYTDCSISFTGGDGSGASAEAIISPFGGHGSDPVTELGAFNLLTKVKFEGDEGGVIVSSNEYRKIGLITNPLVYGSLKQGQARTSGLTTSQMTLSSTDSSTNDIHNGKKLYIYSGKGRGQLRTVEDYVGSTKLLTVTEPFDVLPDNTSYYGFLATDTVINQCLVLNYSTISGTAEIPADTTIYQGTPGSETSIGTVVQHDTVNKKVYVTNLSKSSGAVTTYPYFSTISTTTGSSTFTTTSVDNVGVEPNTGTVLYVENRTPLSRYVEQIEDIRVIIQF